MQIDRQSSEPGTRGTEARPLKVLSLTCTYPHALEPMSGIFIRSRLQALALHADITVIAPVPALDYSHITDRLFRPRPAPYQRQDQRLRVLHPIWFHPPCGTWINALLLCGRLLPTVMRLRRHFHFDVIDAHFGFPTGIAAGMIACSLGVPFIVTLRGNETMHAQSAPVKIWMKWMLRRASCIITVSERLRTFALGFGIPPDRVKTIPNGIDSSVFYPRDRTSSRQALAIAEQTKVILSVGALIERKGHHFVLRAAASLLRESPDLLVIIAGGPGPEGHYEDRLRALVNELRVESAVRFTGAISPGEIAQLMGAADVFCLASSREGWPNVVHEAMACGTPVVANNVGAIPEMIASTERGSIVPPGDSLALEHALRGALSKSWDRNAISAWAQSRSWDTVGAEVYREIEHVVNSSRGAEK